MDINEHPLVSVVIVAYNHEEYISQAIESACNQSYPNIEVLVIDDASTDNTPNIISELLNKYKFCYIRNKKNLGSASANFYRALNYIKGDFLAVLSGDDYLHPDKIAHQVKLMKKMGADAVLSNMYIVDSKNNVLGKIVSDHFLVSLNTDNRKLVDVFAEWSGYHMIQSGLFKLQAVRECSFVWEKCKLDDAPLVFWLIYKNYKIYFDTTALTFYRIHSSNTNLNIWKAFLIDLSAVNIFPEKYKLKAMAGVFKGQVFRLLTKSDYKIGEIIKLSVAKFILSPNVRSFKWMVKAIATGLLIKNKVLLKIANRIFKDNKLFIVRSIANS